MTYTDHVIEYIKGLNTGYPIYSSNISKSLSSHYGMEYKDANAAVAVAMKRIMDGKLIPNLRCYQKGVYYLTSVTPFGEIGINKEQLIADKYLLPNEGYESGYTVMHRLGLTSQMPKERVIITNNAKNGTRKDAKLDVVISPPKVKVTEKNKEYLQTLDVLELMDKAPVDDIEPYKLIAGHIKKSGLDYVKLLEIADIYYGKNTVINLAHTARNRGF